VLGRFAQTKTNEERAHMLASAGYGSVPFAFDADVTVSACVGPRQGDLMRPNSGRHFFGRFARVRKPTT
jgi:hypothetical protein